MDLFRLEIALGIGRAERGWARDRLLEIRGVARFAAERHVVLARFGGDHELLRLAAPHRARVRLDGQILKTAAIEDAAVSHPMLLVADVEPFRRQVERVAVFHRELTDAQQARFGTRFVAEFRLNLIPDLGQLLVAAQLAARDEGHVLLVRHGQAQLASEAILQLEEVIAHHVVAARFLPQLGRVQRGQKKLLGADGIHLLADDGGDLQNRALREIEEVVDSGGEGPDITRAEQELVADGLRLGRGLAQGGDEEMAPEHAKSYVFQMLNS